MDEKFPQRAVHLDFHTMPRVEDVGIEFNADEFAQTLSDAHVDFITVFARCNLGFAYYPTEVGIVHPGIQTDDMLGPMIEACHGQNIRVAAYINAGLDHEHALRHREWCKLNKTGQVYNVSEMGHYFRSMCLNTGYGEHLMRMVDELLTNYPVDGLFLDCFDLSPCYGVECLSDMDASGLDKFDDDEVGEFCVRMTDAFLEKVKNRTRQLAPGICLYFNGIRYRNQPTHIELEVLPPAWGYDYLPFAIRYARTLGKPYFTMTGRFHKSWGDFGGIRTAHSLRFDCYYSIINGGTCSIGDHMHPRGKLDPEVYRLIGNTYAEIEALEPWTAGASALSEIVVLDPRLSRVPGEYRIRQGHSLQGAARMLPELNCQFDMSDGDIDLSGYRVVILPDDVPLDEKLAASLTQYLENGGAIISSAYAGLKPDKSGFALDAYRVNYEGPEPYDFTFFEAQPGIDFELPDMLTTIYEPGIAMTAAEGSEVLAKLHKPYFNHEEWDLYHEHLYIPPKADTGRPALVNCGNLFHFSFPIFKNYIYHAVVPHRTLFRNCLARLLPNPIVKVENLPSFGQVTVTAAENRRMVHLLTYVPELRGKAQIIEEPISVRDISVSLRIDEILPKSAYSAPTGEKLDFTVSEGYARVAVPEVCGYELVVFEA